MTNSPLRNSSVDIIFPQAVGVYIPHFLISYISDLQMPQGLLNSGDGGGAGGEKSPCICLRVRCTHRQEGKIQRIFQESPQLLLEGSQLPKLIDRLRKGCWENQNILGILACLLFFIAASHPTLIGLQIEPLSVKFWTKSNNNRSKVRAFPSARSELDLHLTLGYHRKYIPDVALGTGYGSWRLHWVEYCPLLNGYGGYMDF